MVTSTSGTYEIGMSFFYIKIMIIFLLFCYFSMCCGVIFLIRVYFGVSSPTNLTYLL